MTARDKPGGGEPEAPFAPSEGAPRAAGALTPPSLELLHARYKTRLMSFFLRRLGHSPDVDDLVQETFLRLARPNQLQSVNDIEAYLFQVATNLVLERGRRRTTRASDAHVELDPDLEDILVFSPERILASKEELNAILRTLEELPARTRTIFALQRFEGYTYAQIARKLGVTESAIDKQMARALEHLARRLEQLK